MQNEKNDTFDGGGYLEKEKTDDTNAETVQEAAEKKKGKLSFVSVFLFVFILTFFVLVTLIMLGTKLLGYQMLTVDSGSMEPNFPEE